jgi:hypothetical protein
MPPLAPRGTLKQIRGTRGNNAQKNSGVTEVTPESLRSMDRL